MIEFKAKLTEDGHIVIPEEYLQQLDLHSGDVVIVRLGDREADVLTPMQSIRRAQALVRLHIPESRSLSDELIAERHAESQP